MATAFELDTAFELVVLASEREAVARGAGAVCFERVLRGFSPHVAIGDQRTKGARADGANQDSVGVSWSVPSTFPVGPTEIWNSVRVVDPAVIA